METFNIKVVSPEGLVFEKPVWQISACNSSGWFGVRAHHIGFFSSIVPCNMEIAITPEERVQFQVDSGILDFQNSGTCTIIIEGKITQL